MLMDALIRTWLELLRANKNKVKPKNLNMQKGIVTPKTNYQNVTKMAVLSLCTHTVAHLISVNLHKHCCPVVQSVFLQIDPSVAFTLVRREVNYL